MDRRLVTYHIGVNTYRGYDRNVMVEKFRLSYEKDKGIIYLEVIKLDTDTWIKIGKVNRRYVRGILEVLAGREKYEDVSRLRIGDNIRVHDEFYILASSGYRKSFPAECYY